MLFGWSGGLAAPESFSALSARLKSCPFKIFTGEGAPAPHGRFVSPGELKSFPPAVIIFKL